MYPRIQPYTYIPFALLVLNGVRHNLTDCATEDEEVGGRFARSNLRDLAIHLPPLWG